MAKKKIKGPRGGVKHSPGKGHDTKSGLQRKKKFARKAARKRQKKKQGAKEQWERWDALTDEQRKLLMNMKPSLPRPEDE
jgi:hypothetical protein